MGKSVFMSDDDDDYDFLDSSLGGSEPSPAPRSKSFFHDDELDEVYTPREPEPQRRTPQRKTFLSQETQASRDDIDEDRYTDEYDTEDRESRNTGGDKRGLLIVRWLVISGLLGLVLLGAWGVISPPNMPSPDQVVNRVKYDLGITEFPTKRGESFALAFMDAYLSDSKREGWSQEVELFFRGDTLGGRGVTFDGNLSVGISSGPHISNVKELNDNVSMISTITRLTTGIWVNLTVPVFYDNNLDGFTILDLPTLTPFPALSGTPGRDQINTVNRELSDSAMRALAEFFSAWGTNDLERLDLFINTDDAHQRVKNGLNTPGINFVNLRGIEVYNRDSGTTTPGDYIATATVEWESIHLQPVADDSEPIYNSEGDLVKEIEVKTSFVSRYQLIATLGSDNKWSVKDILPEEFLLKYE